MGKIEKIYIKDEKILVLFPLSIGIDLYEDEFGKYFIVGELECNID